MHRGSTRIRLTLLVTTFFVRIIGKRFNMLDAAIQQFHSIQDAHRLNGRYSTQRPQSFVGRVICALMRLPSPSQVDLSCFNLEPDQPAFGATFPNLGVLVAYWGHLDLAALDGSA